MGFLDRRREARERQVALDRQSHAQTQLQQWQDAEASLVEFIDEAKNFYGETDVALMLKKGETAYLVLDGAALIEPCRLPGTWQGRSSGYSFRIAKGVTYRIGGTKGTYVQGEERPQPIDEGVVTVTNQRTVFQGTKASREWLYPKLLGVQHVDLPGTMSWSAIQVSNRQKVSGFMYPDDHAALIQFRLALALARFHDDVDRLTSTLEQELQAHRDRRPLPAALPVAPTLDPGSG